MSSLGPDVHHQKDAKHPLYFHLNSCVRSEMSEEQYIVSNGSHFQRQVDCSHVNASVSIECRPAANLCAQEVTTSNTNV